MIIHLSGKILIRIGSKHSALTLFCQTMAGGSASNTSNARAWRRPSESSVGYRYFVSDKARKRFNEIFLKKGGKMIERNIDINDFASSGIKQQFTLRGWLGLCSKNEKSHPMMVREFFANVTEVDIVNGFFFTYVRGLQLRFSVDTVRNILQLPVVENPQWPFAPEISPDREEVFRELTDHVATHLADLSQGLMAPQFRMLHKIVCNSIEPVDHIHSVPISRAHFLYAVGLGYSVDLGKKIWTHIFQYAKRPPGTAGIPFASLLTRFMLGENVSTLPDEPTVFPMRAIDSATERLSTAQNATLLKAKRPSFLYPSKYPSLVPLFPPVHAPQDYNPPWNDTSPTSQDVPPPSASASDVPPPPSLDPVSGGFSFSLEVMDLIRQQFGFWNSRMDGLEERFEAYEAKFESISAYHSQFSESFSVLQNALSLMASQLAKMESRIDMDYTSPVEEDEEDDDPLDED